MMRQFAALFSLRQIAALFSLRQFAAVAVAALCACGKPASHETPDAGGAPPPKVTVCPNAPAPGPCTATKAGAGLLITGTLLLPGEIVRGGALAVDATGKITCAGCDCTNPGASTIVCGSAVVSPALVNPHDHIDYDQNPPLADSGERYEQRSDWRLGLRGHTKLDVRGGATAVQQIWIELRGVMAGTTSTIGAAGTPGLLRNLDRGLDEGLNHQAASYDTFPLGDLDGTQLTSGCAYPAIEPESKIAGDSAYLPHVAEGVDDVARNEFVCLTSTANGGQDLAQPQSAFIHSVALEANDYELLSTDKTSMVWSPRSNVRLYGATADVVTASRTHARIALGTDWLASGSMNLLRELRCADSLNQRWSSWFTDEQLWLMVTRDAAAVTGYGDVLGVLQTGYAADVAIFDASAHADHRAILDANPQDVLLVLRGGVPLYGESAIIDVLTGGGCDALNVCGAMKSACLMSDVNQTLAGLMAQGANAYPLFFCDAPPDEPTCTPMRGASVGGSSTYTGMPASGDRDGDGVPDATDDCPDDFNPIRPLDHGAQADADHDGRGDVCDPFTFDPKG